MKMVCEWGALHGENEVKEVCTTEPNFDIQNHEILSFIYLFILCMCVLLIYDHIEYKE